MSLKLTSACTLSFLLASAVIASENSEKNLVDNVVQIATSDAPLEAAKSMASSQVDGAAEKLISDWLPHAEISVEGLSNGKPTFSILTVNPLYESEDYKHTFFNQTSIFSQDGRHTLNVGFGYRNMTDNEKWLFGVNGFYDYEFPYDHQRASLGIEARSSVAEFNANRYFGLSDWKQGENSLEEKALGGYDYEVGLSIPYMPGARVFHKEFLWDTELGLADLEGSTTSVLVNGNILIPGLELEAGSTNYNSGAKDTNFIRLSFSYPPPSSSKKIFSKKAYEFTSMKENRLDKVRRENKIVKQTSFAIVVDGY